MYKCAIGQDSHRFAAEGSAKPLRLGGALIAGCVGLEGNSDADVVLHALTNAISGISGVNILGAVSDRLCIEQGITDSSVYLQKALESLGALRVCHASVSVEGKRPILASHIDTIKAHIAHYLAIEPADVGFTATSGEGLTAFGRGEGIAAIAVVTAVCENR